MKHYHYSELTSTSDKAKELIKLEGSQSSPILAVTADVQTKGRGRNGKVWLGSHNANVYCSIALKHRTEPRELQLVTYQVVGCLAAKAALQELSIPKAINEQKVDFILKYPNDVYITQRHEMPIRRRKICGVLVEHEFIGHSCVASIIGIGINVRQNIFPSEIEHKATSLLREGVDVRTDDVRDALLRYLQLFLKQSSEALFQAWREELQLEFTTIAIHGEQGFWRVERLQEDGRLLVKHTETQRQRFVDNGDSILRVDW